MERGVKYYLAELVPFTLSRTEDGEGFSSQPRSLTQMGMAVRCSENGSLHEELTDDLRSTFGNWESKWNILIKQVAGSEKDELEFYIQFQGYPSLKNVLGESACLQVEIFDAFNASGEQLNGFAVQVSTSGNVEVAQYCEDSVDHEASYQIVHQAKDQPVSGKMNLVLIDKSFGGSDDCYKLTACKRKQEEELLTGSVILPDKGLQTIFSTDMPEVKRRRMEMPDMTEASMSCNMDTL